MTILTEFQQACGKIFDFLFDKDGLFLHAPQHTLVACLATTVMPVVPTHIQYAMNIIILVLLAIVMASVDQSYFGAPNFVNSVNRQAISSVVRSL